MKQRLIPASVRHSLFLSQASDRVGDIAGWQIGDMAQRLRREDTWELCVFSTIPDPHCVPSIRGSSAGLAFLAMA